MRYEVRPYVGYAGPAIPCRTLREARIQRDLSTGIIWDTKLDCQVY